MATTSDDNVIELPTADAPTQIRESFRSVLRSHMFVVCDARKAQTTLDLDAFERAPAYANADQDGGDRVDVLRTMVRAMLAELRQRNDVLTPERFESLLVELGNNAMQRLHSLAIERDLDAREANDWTPHLSDLANYVRHDDWIGALRVLARMTTQAAIKVAEAKS